MQGFHVKASLTPMYNISRDFVEDSVGLILIVSLDTFKFAFVAVRDKS